MSGLYSSYVNGNVISDLSQYFMFFNFDITYCSDMSWLYCSYAYGNIISQLFCL